MALEHYRQKRHFDRTPEPRGGRRHAGGHLFVVQKHAATHLHYDFRLQIDGAMASWAIPKGPSLNPAEKRLAVHVEDHPVEYAEFEGTIPQGEYGAGTVMIWDTGTWKPLDEDPAKALSKGKLSFELEGKKLHGGWTLTRLAGRGRAGSRDNWLLIKHRDRAAARDGQVDDDHSAATGKTMEEIAGSAEPRRRASAAAARRTRPAQSERASGTGAVASARGKPMPRLVHPQLCTLVAQPPRGEEWLHETKFDGYRIIAWRRNSELRLLTRTGQDWTERFPAVAEAIRRLDVAQAIIDGEITILGEHGRTHFQQLQNALTSGRNDKLVYFVFDLLYLDGHDLQPLPLIERKGSLRKLLPGRGGALRFSEHTVGGGSEAFRKACNAGLEGIISKRSDAPYVQKRSGTWLKIKCSLRQEFVVIGWTPPEGAREHLGALLLGAYDPKGRLIYTGRVGTGFTNQSLKELKARLEPLERTRTAADEPPRPDESRGVRWATPKLVAEVEFTEWTDDGRLRHPSFQGLREDKDPRSVGIERPGALKADARKHAPASGTKTGESVVAGIRITHPQRVVFPVPGHTKLDLARYYEKVGERIMRFIAGRPLSTVRCPEGQSGECFFQKHLRRTIPAPVRAIHVRELAGPADYIGVDSVEGLVTLIQFGVIEVHPWGAAEKDLEHPDVLTFDLDPAPDVSFRDVKSAAIAVRDRLTSVGLSAFLKVSGGKGLHVVAPLVPDTPWELVRAFSAHFARTLAASDPARYVATASKAVRPGRVFIDYLRNSRGATSVAPYSVRARSGAPVALPIAWDELSRLTRPDQFSLAVVLRRLSHTRADPWSTFERARRSISKLHSEGR